MIDFLWARPELTGVISIMIKHEEDLILIKNVDQQTIDNVQNVGMTVSQGERNGRQDAVVRQMYPAMGAMRVAA